mmetsp:Transcript_11145/g.19485  ORF Transcript_11145/g.19485 Transcript_11145/m.19485 type:complete len:317 (-) Transcript_11145:706-1656(-)|eukprot:CAMPEP_0119102168 /NCGR_PEP_ID=MMETSP1180-20130426/1011_1 /TAXON_ID=3052 ORGANISM="Chlamydomonas cf sp, Strain CCMP681" /NCGR_SAMPLE_ID=MMETSP1180 /ASSEMBLY_ACC=CAM_ASM_000741 /LENGTH=316 /DNA_ID=CAMNT_0007086411 /DNA_START=144 /DNA_END=1094 /DNA_ORIENTATION=+
MPRLTTIHNVDAHDEGVWSAAWVPHSTKLLTGSLDESVKSWEEGQDSLAFKHCYQGHSLGVVSVVVNSTGEVAAASALDAITRVWNLNTHETVSLIEAAATETWSLAFNPTATDGIHLATAAGTRSGVVIWSIKPDSDETAMLMELTLPQATEDRLRAKERFVLSVAYSPDGQRLACGAMDGTVAIFDVATGKHLNSLQGHFKPVRSLQFLPDSKTLLTACDDMHINLHDVENASLIDAFSGHESWVLSVSAHPSGTCFASGGSDAKVKLWDLGTRTCCHTASDHTDQVWSVAFNEDGSRLLSTGDDKKLVTYSCA